MKIMPSKQAEKLFYRSGFICGLLYLAAIFLKNYEILSGLCKFWSFLYGICAVSWYFISNKSKKKEQALTKEIDKAIKIAKKINEEMKDVIRQKSESGKKDEQGPDNTGSG